MSIATEITRLQTAKANLKTAIEGKGVTVPSSATIDDYADLVDSISGGGGLDFDWADVEEVTIGANSVTNTAAVSTYFSGYTYSFVILSSALTTNNQFVLGSCQNQDGVMGDPHRYRDGKIVQTVIGANYDAKLVEGTKYYLLKRKA